MAAVARSRLVPAPPRDRRAATPIDAALLAWPGATPGRPGNCALFMGPQHVWFHQQIPKPPGKWRRCAL